MLNDAETICVASILQDGVDRLHIIGRLLPIPTSVIEIGPISKPSGTITEKVVHNVRADISKHELFPKNLVNEIQTKATFDEELFKLQRDRTFLEDVLQKTLSELKTNNTYNGLQEALDIETGKTQQLEDIIEKEAKMKERIAKLEKVLTKTKKQTEELVKHCREEVAHLTDQLREAKVKTNLEEIYVTTQSFSNMLQSRKKLRVLEDNILNDIEEMKQQIENGKKINLEFENYIKQSLNSLSQKMEHWMEKYENDTENLEKETEHLRIGKQNCVDRCREIRFFVARCVSGQEAAMIFSVMEEALEQLEIIKKLMPSVYPEMDEKWKILNDHVEWECHDLLVDDFENKNPMMKAISKLHHGRMFLEESLQKLMNECKSKHSYDSLIQIIKNETQRKDEEIQFTLNLEKDKLKIASLKKQLKNSNAAREQNVAEAEANVTHLTGLLKKTKLKNRCNENYVEKQEIAKKHFMSKKFQDEISQLKEDIIALERKIENEKKTHEEIVTFLSKEYKSIEEELNSWIVKYEEGIKKMDKATKELIEEKEAHLQVYNALFEKCETYKKVLREDFEAKEAIRRKIELEAKRQRSAIIIQCWWRAVMVRRFLGEFKYIRKLMKRRKTKSKIKKLA